MSMGRNLDLAALIAASNRLNPALNSSLANSTIRIAFLAAIPINITKDTWAKILFSKVGLKSLAAQRKTRAPKMANGVPNNIENGKDQLSY